MSCPFSCRFNALVFHDGKGIEAATLTERIEQLCFAKSCAKGQAPLELPTTKRRYVTLSGNISPFVSSSPFTVCVISVLQAEIDEEKRYKSSAANFLRTVRKYTEIKELAPTIVNELIEKIVVRQAKGHRQKQDASA